MAKILIVLLFLSVAKGQEQQSMQVGLKLDGFYATWGPVYYPRVNWLVKANGITVKGAEFIYTERNPGQWFANQPITVTVDRLWWLSLRGELGKPR